MRDFDLPLFENLGTAIFTAKTQVPVADAQSVKGLERLTPPALFAAGQLKRLNRNALSLRKAIPRGRSSPKKTPARPFISPEGTTRAALRLFPLAQKGRRKPVQ